MRGAPRTSSRAVRPVVPPPAHSPVVTIPVFSDYRFLLADCARLLEREHTGDAYRRLREAVRRTRLIPGPDYARLADDLQHAVMAIETGEFEGARYVLLQAMAAQGWAELHAD